MSVSAYEALRPGSHSGRAHVLVSSLLAPSQREAAPNPFPYPAVVAKVLCSDRGPRILVT